MIRRSQSQAILLRLETGFVNGALPVLLYTRCSCNTTGVKQPSVLQDELVVDEDNFPVLGAKAAMQPQRDAWSSPPKLDLHAEAPLLQQSRQSGRAQPLLSSQGMPRSRQPDGGPQGQTGISQGQGGPMTVPWVETGMCFALPCLCVRLAGCQAIQCCAAPGLHCPCLARALSDGPTPLLSVQFLACCKPFLQHSMSLDVILYEQQAAHETCSEAQSVRCLFTTA